MSVDWIPTGPTRKIPAKERGNRGIILSHKIENRIVEYESCLERDFFLLCNHAPDVTSFQHQPITISYLNKLGNMRKYTPDGYVEFKNGVKGLFEIKYQSEVMEKKEENRERWEIAKKWAEERNIIFAVLTDVEIRNVRLYNVWFTLGSSKASLIDRYTSKLISLIPDNGEKYNILCYLLSESEGLEINKSAQILCYAIYHGLVHLDTFSTKELSKNSIIRRKYRKKSLSFKSLLDELNILSSDIPELANKDLNFVENSYTNNLLSSISYSIPEKYVNEVKMRKKIVSLWLKQPKNNRTAEWRNKFCNKHKVNEKTVYLWVKNYKSGGIEGLIPKYYKSGRKTILSKKTLELMEIARLFYTKPLKTLKNSYKKLVELCKEEFLEPPIEQTFRTYIYKNSTAADFARKHGKKYYKSSFTPSLSSFQGAYIPMQIIQMDNTRFDVFPVDSENRETLPTPYMTAAIDCYSRMITGFNVSYFPSSSHTVLEVLIQSILSKKNNLNVYETQQEWPIQGFPLMILVDNGMDYRSKQLKEFCMEYDIIVEYAPIRTPRYKAYIEQWFNILRNTLVSEDVSGFRPLLKQRLENPELKPENNAILTLQEIESWLHKWIIDEYHFTNPYDNHEPAPFLRWQDFKDAQTNIILPLPREPPQYKMDVDLLNLSVFKKIKRTLGYHGVVWEHLKYNSKELAKKYEEIGKEKVSVLVNFRDIREVWVIFSNSIKPLKVELASGWAQAIAKIHGDMPIHASAWKKEVKILKKRLKTKITPHIYNREISRLKRDEIISNAKKESKSIRKEKEKAYETNRKSFSKKIQSTKGAKNDENTSEQASIYKRRKIDWSKIKPLPTDDFPKEV